ncbi:type II toxin -antitoxin system TacA 1-like antitoxin [Microcoleus sp. D3_18a_C4]|uniref:type II toxin -antitoxin system TacA 1-like antitoxin n=1 Tax=Microcoleus sp. D3_18a_C4 TaxID=3055332 RepID=UPI002FD1176A
MRSLVKTETSTETRLSWWAYLFVLDEFIAEADATINGPAALGNPVLKLSERDWDFLLDMMLDPPPPNEALIKLFQDYRNSNKE